MVLREAVARPARTPAEPPRSPVLSGWRDEFVALTGRVIVLGGFWSLVSLVLRPVRWIRWIDDLFGLVNLPAGPSLFSTVLLFVVGGAVRRRMKVSLWLLLAFQALAGLNLLGAALQLALDSDEVHRTRPIEVAELVVNLPLTVLLVVLLWRSRAAFSSRLEAGARWRALGILVAGLIVSVSVTIALTLSFPDTLTDIGHQLAWAVRVSLGVEPTSAEVGWEGKHGHHWIAALSGLLSALALVLAALVFLRSARAKAYLTAQDELEVRRLLLQAGERDSLGYFATRHDKSVIFAPGQAAAVTYRVLANVSLASADPIGPPAAWPAAIAAWLAEARAFGWFPAVLSASEEGAQAYVAAGLKALPIGDEAIIDVDTFTLEGPDHAAGPAGGAPGAAGRLHHLGAPARRPERRAAGRAGPAGRGLAWRGHRARLLDGARPGRRPEWTAAAWRCWPTTPTAGCAGCCRWCRGAGAACRWT